MNEFTAAADILKQQQAGNPFARAAEQLKARQAGQVGMSIAYDEASPDDAARSLAIGKELGVAPSIVQADMQTFDARARMKQAAEKLRNAPATAAWLSDMGNGTLAKDDLDNLTWFESLKAQGQRVALGATGMVESSLRARAIKERGLQAGIIRSAPDRVQEAQRQADKFDEILSRGLSDDGKSPMSDAERSLYEQRRDEARMAVRQWTDVQEVGPAFAGPRAEQFDRMAESLAGWASKTIGEPPQDDSLWSDLAYGLGSMIAFVGPSLLPGGQFASAQMGADAARTEAYDRAISSGATEEDAQVAGNIAGFFGTSEAIPIASMLNRIPKKLRGGLLGAVATVIGDMLKSSIEEGTQEFGMALAQNVIAKLTYDPDQEVLTEDAARQGIIGAILGPLVSGPISTVREVRQAIRDGAAAAQPSGAAEMLAEVDEKSAASKLRERSPDKFRELLEAQGLGDQAIYVPADALREYFQAKDMAFDEETMRAWGIDPITFEEAAQAGQDVSIPIPNYAAYIQGTEAASWLADNATSDPDEMSNAMARAFNDSVQEVMQRAFEEAEAARKTDEELRAADVQIYDDVFSQLRAAGRSPDVAQNEARVWAAFWRTMGERYNEDPLDLARAMGVDIRGPQSPAFRRRSELDLALNTLRAKGTKALKPQGLSLAEFVKSKGGVRDTGGDVAALEPAKGVVAETAKEARDRQSQPTLDGLPAQARGLTLDEMGRMAAEAGYFPDLLGEVMEGTKGEASDFAARLLEALSEDVAGRKVFAEGEGPDAAMQALSDALSERGLDPATMTNDEIAAALDAADGQTLNQGALTNADVEAFAADIKEKLGLETLSMFLSNGDIRLNLLVVPKDAQRNGAGTKAMEAITAFADQNGKRITLSPALKDDRKGTTSRARLVKFYKRFGFVENKGRNKDFSIIDGMYREPIGTLFQSAPLKTDTPEFRAWAGGDVEILSGDEIADADFSGPGPFVMKVFHGTTHAFEAFDASYKGQKGGHFGAVNYFTSDAGDATGNYSGIGPDLTVRIENAEERIADQIEGMWPDILDAASDPEDAFADLVQSLSEEYDFDSSAVDDMFIDNDPDEGVDAVALASYIARSTLVGGEEKLLEVYVRTEKPFVVDAANGETPWAEFRDFDVLESAAIERVAENEGVSVDDVTEDREDYDDQIDEARWEIESEESSPLYEAIEAVAMRYELDAQELFGAVAEMDMEGARHGDFEKALRDAESVIYAEDPETGEMIGPHIIAEVIRELGFDAIILKRAEAQFHNMAIGDNVSHIHVFDQHNSNIKSVHNRGTFDPADPRIMYQPGKRGSIVLPSGGLTEGQTVINLFEAADLSSFLHESGHFFLEAFQDLSARDDAPQAMKDDMAAILDWFGVKDWSEVKVEHHEKWARGFEAYTMEGKAPSLALADAFARFKSWLTRIYKTALGLNVKITPEIRDVMDRMLATDAEIAEARAQMEMGPLFSDAPPGMSDADFKTYQRLARRASEAAEQSLLEKTMAKVRREKEAWFRSEKKAVTAEVIAETERQPRYRLINMLANQKWAGSDEAVPDMQIDRAMLVDQFGEGVLPELSRNRLGGKRAIYGDGGASPEEVAQFFGFDGAADMIEVLQNTPKMKDAVAMEVDRRMTERHGDPLNDGTIEEEALAAIHNAQQADTAVAEARHIAKQLGRSTGGMTAKLYRQRARLMVGRMAVRDVIKPERFLAAERKAARAAQDAFAKVTRGTKPEVSLAAALQAKEQQILNGFIYDEARKVSEEVQKGREKMRAYSKKSVRERLEGGYIEQIDAILEDYDFRVRGKKQVARAESLRAFIDRMVKEGREGELNIDERLLDEAQRKHYTRLSVDELRGLFDTVDNLDHMGRFKQKLIDRARKRDLLETVDKVSGQIKKNLGTGKAGERARVGAFFNLLWRTDTLLVRMDGGEEIGPSYEEIKRPIDEAVSLEQGMQVEMANRLDKLFKSHYSASDIAKMKKQRHIQGANGRPWSKMEILSVALNLGNEDGFARLTAEDAAVQNRLTREQVETLMGQMTETDWRFVQDMWDMVGSYWGGLSEVAKRRTGVAPKKVEPKLMVAAPDFVTGGYYPIKYDPTLSAAAATDEASAWDKFTATGRGATAAIRNGMTKQRQKSGGGRTLRLDIQVAFDHMRETVRYIALSEAVDNAHKVISHPTVQNAFLDAGAKDQHDIIRLWLKDTAAGPSPSRDPVNSAARMIKNNFTLSRLAFNFKTVALQVTGVGQSAATIGNKNLIRGYQEYLAHPIETARSVVDKSAFMAERQSTFQKDIYDFANDVELSSPIAGRYRKAKSGVAKAGFAPIVWTQFWAVDMPTWLGAFRAGVEKYGDEAKAITFADRMVARAQDSGLLSDRSAFERGTLSESQRQSDWIRLFTTLGGYMMTKMNRAYVSMLQARMGWQQADTGAQKVAVASYAASSLAMLYLTEAIMVALVYAAMTDEEDKEGMADLLLRETGSAMVGGIPFARDAFSAFAGYGGGGVYGSVMEAPAKFFVQAAQGENDAALRRAAADIFGTVTGLPTTGPMRAIEAAIDDDTPLSEAIFGRNPLTR